MTAGTEMETQTVSPAQWLPPRAHVAWWRLYVALLVTGGWHPALAAPLDHVSKLLDEYASLAVQGPAADAEGARTVIRWLMSELGNAVPEPLHREPYQVDAPLLELTKP